MCLEILKEPKKRHNVNELSLGSWFLDCEGQIYVVIRDGKSDKNKVKDRPQIRSSKDAYLIFESHWSNQIALQEEFNILLLDRANRTLAVCSISTKILSGVFSNLFRQDFCIF